MDSKIISLFILSHCRGLGPLKIRKLIEEFGSPEKIIEQGWDSKKRVLFQKWEVANWEEDLEKTEKEGVYCISYQDPSYPKNLLNIPDFPLILYVKGNYLPNDLASLAIIGTRNASLYGMQQAEKIATEVASADVCIISGLARGIDTAAHNGALKNGGKTIAVIGSGLSNIYPRENLLLAEKIADSGAIVSEFPMGTAPAKGLFPRRNRIVSGISDGICLIESPIEGGGMITMQIGERHQKRLFALPGRVDSLSFGGNHLLLKEKKAFLVENSSDLLKHLNIIEKNENKPKKILFLTDEEEAFLKKLPSEEKTIEELVLLTQLPVMQLNVHLTRLVLKKLVKEFPGKIYKKNV